MNEDTYMAGLISGITGMMVMLKICGVLSWSWLWVLSPLWIPAAIIGALLLLALLISMFND